MNISSFNLQWKHITHISDSDKEKVAKMVKIASKMDNMPSDIVMRLKELTVESEQITDDEFRKLQDAFSFAPNIVALGISLDRNGIFYNSADADDEGHSLPELNEEQLRRIFASVKDTMSFTGEITVVGTTFADAKRCLINESDVSFQRATGYIWEAVEHSWSPTEYSWESS